jgi:hypothetical protein
MWAVRNCNVRPTDELASLRKLSVSARAQAFMKGLEAGASEALEIERNSGRQAGCTLAYIMYGKNGMNAAGLLEWTGPVQAR